MKVPFCRPILREAHFRFAVLILISILAVPTTVWSQTQYTTASLGNNQVSITGFSTTTFGPLSVPSTLNGSTVVSIGANAFANNFYIASVTIPDTVTSIGANAFSGCYNLLSITLPGTISSIGAGAFACPLLSAFTVTGTNTYLSSVGGVLFNANQSTLVQYPPKLSGASFTIPSTVTTIGNSAFASCGSLTSITIPGSVTSIGNNAFFGCSGLTSIAIPSGVTSIGSQAFLSCTKLASITVSPQNTIYSSVSGMLCDSAQTKIIQYPLGSTTTDFAIPSSFTSIGAYAFSGTAALATVTLPVSVVSIGNYAFNSCPALTVAVFLGNAPTIGTGAFSQLSSGFTLSYKNEVTGFSTPTFTDSSTESISAVPMYGTSVTNNQVSITRFTGAGGPLTVPATISGLPVVAVGTSGFSGDARITSVSLPSGITSLGNYAFLNCSLLQQISIPASVTQIGSGAFGNCTSLTTITLPTAVTTIADSLFVGCTGLTSANFSPGITSIGFESFDGCTSLASITIPNQVTSIGEDAFYSCTSLTSVVIPDSVTDGGTDSFRGCTGLTSVTLGHGLTVVDMFNGCTSLASIAIPNGVTDIPLQGCTSLTALVLPDSITSIDYEAYANDTSLTSITMGKGFLTLGEYAFGGCNSLTSINVSSQNTNYSSIGGVLCSQGGTVLVAYPPGKPEASYTIPNGITEVATASFNQCGNLTSVIIPADVTRLDSEAFAYTTGLQSATFLGNVPTMGNEVFNTATGTDTSNFAVYYFSGATGGFTTPTWRDAGGDTYAAFPVTPRIAFPAIANQPLGAPPMTLSATVTDGLAPVFSVTGPATLSGTTLTVTGAGTVTVVASQPGDATHGPAQSVSRSFLVAAPMAFGAWEAQPGFYTTAQQSNSAVSGPTATPQNDGVPNLLKYFYDINPSRPMSAADQAALPAVGMMTDGQGTYLTLTYRENALKSDVVVAVQTSTDLHTWLAPSNVIIVPVGTDPATGDPMMQAQVPESGPAQFIRLNAIQE